MVIFRMLPSLIIFILLLMLNSCSRSSQPRTDVLERPVHGGDIGIARSGEPAAGISICSKASTFKKCIDCCVAIASVQTTDKYLCVDDKSMIKERKANAMYLDKPSLDRLSPQLYSYLCSSAFELNKSGWSIDECRKECEQKK